MFLHYRTVGGVHVHADQLTITVPTAMMVKALDMLLDRMAEAKFPFEKVLAIGGDNQVCNRAYPVVLPAGVLDYKISCCGTNSRVC